MKTLCCNRTLIDRRQSGEPHHSGCTAVDRYSVEIRGFHECVFSLSRPARLFIELGGGGSAEAAGEHAAARGSPPLPPKSESCIWF